MHTWRGRGSGGAVRDSRVAGKYRDVRLCVHLIK